jgi:nitroreductase
VDLFEAIQKRKSVRKFKNTPFEDEKIQKALEAAVLAPNSSNVQTWDFYWIKSPELKASVVKACLSQSAARTANQLVVVVADPKKWKRSHKSLINFVEKVNAPKLVKTYYSKLIPITYRWGLLNSIAPIKWLITTSIGFFRPITRGPNTRRDLQEVAIKSAALAAENFVLAISAQGGDTCMMEGFDDFRLRRLLKLSCSAKILMVIGIGYEGERATWGPRFRIPVEQVVHSV